MASIDGPRSAPLAACHIVIIVFSTTYILAINSVCVCVCMCQPAYAFYNSQWFVICIYTKLYHTITRTFQDAQLISSMNDDIRRPCSDFMDMLRRLINCHVIIIIIIHTASRVHSSRVHN